MKFFLLFTLIFFIFSGVIGSASTDKIQSISVMRGDSVTLHTDVTEVQREDLILWTFGAKDNLIAEIHKQVVYMYDNKGLFRLEQKTGSLTLRNIKLEHSGLYELTAINRGKTSHKRFNVTVGDTLKIDAAYLPVPVISRESSPFPQQNCSLLCSVVNVSHVTLSWFKGNSVLSSISVSDLSISLSLSLEVDYQEKNTYSCVLHNSFTNHTIHLDISQLCQPCSDSVPCCSSTEAVVRLVISALVGVATVIAVIFDIRS